MAQYLPIGTPILPIRSNGTSDPQASVLTQLVILDERAETYEIYSTIYTTWHGFYNEIEGYRGFMYRRDMACRL